MDLPHTRHLGLRKYVSTEAFLYLNYRATHRITPWSLADDKAFLRLKYRQKFDRSLSLRHPTSFNEKLNWMKIYDRRPLYTQLADKYRVRDYVEQEVGSPYLNRLYGVFRTVGEIAWDDLPSQFVLKVNHCSKGNVICPDKDRLDWETAVRRLERGLSENGYFPRREWPYRDIEPVIIAEEFLAGDPNLGLLDYKFFCFGGEPKYVAVDFDRFGHHSQFFYDMQWRRQPFIHGLPTPDHDAPRPEAFDEMRAVATKLAADLPFVRVDLYEHLGGVRFGEMTLHPAGSLKPITPEEYDEILGGLIRLPMRDR